MRYDVRACRASLAARALSTFRVYRETQCFCEGRVVENEPQRSERNPLRGKIENRAVIVQGEAKCC